MSAAPGLASRLAWEAAQGLGLLAIACTVLLCLVPLRPRAGVARTLTLALHTRIGWLALGAAALHAVILPGIDHTVREHLKSTTPFYEWAGIVALLLFVALTVPATESCRRRLWQRHRNFQALHVALTALALVLIAVHVIGTARYLHAPWAAIAYATLSAAALLALLRRRRGAASGAQGATLAGGLVFGRHSHLVLALLCVAAVAIAALAWPGARAAVRGAPLTRTARLPLDFPHEKHRAVRCVECHHDFLDHSGAGSCIACHRSQRTDLRLGAEARFHGFCLDCHRDPPARLEHHGPVVGCDACHVPGTLQAAAGT